MSLFAWFADTRAIARELKRIADALERHSPPPPTGPVEPIQPEDIAYATDEAMAVEELREEARRLGILTDEEHEPSHES